MRLAVDTSQMFPASHRVSIPPATSRSCRARTLTPGVHRFTGESISPKSGCCTAKEKLEKIGMWISGFERTNDRQHQPMHGVGKCSFLVIVNITFKYLLEIVSPIVG